MVNDLIRSIERYRVHKTDPEAVFNRFRGYSPSIDRLIEIPHLQLGRLTREMTGSFRHEYEELEQLRSPARRTLQEWAEENFGSAYYRISFSRLDAGASIAWHEHESVVRKVGGRDVNARFVIHVPLTTDSRCQMLVDYRGDIIAQHYGEGEIWLLNSYYPHAVVNASPIARVHCILFLDSMNETVIEKIWSLSQ